jgi:pimeloyl-ACP methyl ester carboxylesterase
MARFPVSPPLMAACIRAWRTADLVSACRRVVAPTLVVTGDPDLDQVVPVSSSLEYLRLIDGARHVRMERTGHLGLVARPDIFARTVKTFVELAADTGVPGGR